MAAHIPAWKRLGLQLKTTAAQNVAAEAPPPTKKRKLSSNGQPPRLADIVEGGPQKFAHLNIRSSENSSSLNAASSSTEDGTITKLSKKRKSVSFDAASKEDRADFVHDTPASVATGAHKVADSDSIGSLGPANVDKKKTKRKEKTKSAQVQPPVSQRIDLQSSPKSIEKASKKSSPPYLRYLEQYAVDRASWKFNKSHQIKLLDNLFNLNRVPSTNDDALIDYVKGLQGAGVRARLKEDAERIVSEAPSPQDATASVLKSDSAVHEAIGTSATISNDDSTPTAFKAKQISRARSVLAALASSEPEPTTLSQTKNLAHTNGQIQSQEPQNPRKSKRSRGRVRRGINDVPSSDESSILSESSSDEADG